jgi:hypothetical protein
MDTKYQKEIDVILHQFNRQVSKLMKIANEISGDNPNIEWLTRLFKILRNESPLCILDRCVDKIWDNKDSILKRDAKFFETCDFNKYIKKDGNKEFLDGIVTLVRSKYFDLTEKEQNCIWVCMEEMLKNIIKYRLLKCDFDG